MGVGNRAPDSAVLVLDDVKLVGVVRECVIRAGWSSIGVNRERDEWCGRRILLVIKTGFFLNRQWRKTSDGRRRAWKTRAQRGFKGRKDGRRCRGVNVIRG
jgi:hypothetical protein